MNFDSKLTCGKALHNWGAKPRNSVFLAPGLEVDQIMKGVPEEYRTFSAVIDFRNRMVHLYQ